MSPVRRLRVGAVPYLVARPLDSGLEHEAAIDLVRCVPSELVERLRAAELDVALVSSIELFRRPGYGVLDGLAVASHGPVASVQVFLRCSIERVRSVALDPASRAAATLVRVLFERRLGSVDGLPGASVAWREVELGADPRAIDADAWLRIGDPALREKLASDAPPSFDPAAEWTARTGLPFVFACWIVRPGIDLAPEEIAAFARARRAGEARRESLALEAALAWDLPIDACRRYLLEECRYEPGEAMHAALERFRDEAGALGLCDGALTPRRIAVTDA